MSRRRDSFVGVHRLVVLIVRRDRVRLTLWIGGLIALMAVSAQSIASLYDTPERIRNYVDTVGENVALIMFSGPGYGFDDPNAGVILVNETSLWMALGVALMSVFLVVRHTRAEEDSERADLVRSTIVGRHAPTAAALIVAAGANVMVAFGTTLATAAFGFSLAGTVALASGIGLVGVVFATAAAAAAQLAGTARSALGLAAGLVALAFVVRGIGDIGTPVLSWATPFGWGIGVRAYAGERWLALVGLVVFAAAFTLASMVLLARRDLGSGLLAPRAGPAHAPRWSRHPVGLALRLQRGMIIGFTIGLFITGLVYGSVADDIEDMLAENPDLADFLARTGGATLSEAYLATALRLLALVAAGFAIASALRNRSEEAAGRAESVLATPVSRWRWAGAHLAVTLGATTLLIVSGGLGMGTGYALVIGDGSQIATLVEAALATLPATLVLAGIATALFGWLPHATAAAWGVLALVAVVDIFATVLRLPHWTTLLSPLAHTPSLPAEHWSALPIVLLSGLAIGLGVVGLAGFRRRDLAAA